MFVAQDVGTSENPYTNPLKHHALVLCEITGLGLLVAQKCHVYQSHSPVGVVKGF